MRRLPLLLSLVALGASAWAQSIKGKWIVTYPGATKGTKTVAVFRGGKLTLTQEAPRFGRTMRMIARGRYTRSGSRLTSRLLNAEFDRTTLTASQRRAVSEPVAKAAFLARIRKMPGPEGTISFRGPNRFELKPLKGAPSTFTRSR